MKTIKIIVALRENIYFRIFKQTKQHEPQREKWADVQIRLTWKKEDLINLINLRLKQVYRQQFTTSSPTLETILPETSRKIKRIDPIDFIIKRTFMRPRDMIAFLNAYIESSQQLDQISWKSLFQAEGIYSKDRITSVYDEWKDCFFGMHLAFEFLKKCGGSFKASDLTDDEIDGILSKATVNKHSWISALQEDFLENTITLKKARDKIIKALYISGLIGIRQKGPARFSYEMPILQSENQEFDEDTEFEIHEMFHSFFDVRKPEEVGKPT